MFKEYRPDFILLFLERREKPHSKKIGQRISPTASMLVSNLFISLLNLY